MTLPRPLLHRIRRAIRRQLMIPAGPHSLNRLGWAGGPSDPEPEPPNRMKLSRFILLAAALVMAIGLFVSCVESSKLTTLPDGTKIEEQTKQADPNVLRFGADVVRAYSPREIKRVREEKSGPVSPEEINQRWKPSKP